jgi:protein O-mannosyl-transferase
MLNEQQPYPATVTEQPKLPGEFWQGWRGFAGGTALIFLLAFVVYWPALHGQFVWDDELLVIKNPLVTGLANLGSVWFQTDFSLTTVALWAQWLLWGKNPAGYHVVNVFLHAAGCVLLWRVLARLKIPGAFLAAIIFAVHPVCAVSIAWISEMKNTLSLVFLLLSLRWFLRFEDEAVADRKRKRKVLYWLSFAAFLLALLSKTSTVMLPVLLLGCAWWRRGKVARQDWLRAAPFFLLSLALGGATMWFQARVMAAGDPVQTENFPGRLAAAGMALWFYLGKALLPLNLNMIYPRWKIDSAALLSYLPAFLWCALLALCWWFRGRSRGRVAFFALGSFTVLLFPVLGLLSMDYLVISRVSDHFQYLPLIAVIALIAAALAKVLPGQIFSSVAAMLVVGLAAMTFQRSEIISHNETLWRDTLAKNPESFTAHNNLGCILAAQNNLDAAMEHFRAALKFNPKNASAHCNLGRAYSLQRQFADAENEFQAALKIKPASADIQQAYASALAEQGKMAEAIQHSREAVRLEPRNELRLQLAAWLHKTGNFRESAEQYRAALARELDSVEALNNLAWMLATSPDASVRNGGDAVRFAERACRLTDNKKAAMVGTLAAAYAEAERFADAEATAAKAADLADADGNTQFAAINRQLLALYRAGTPFREPSPESAR